MKAVPTPRPHQLAALEALEAALAEGNRAQAVMACGTGKTLVGRWLAERASAETTLVLVPSLALIAQTLTEWKSVPGWDFESLILCSDPTTAAGQRERASSDGDDIPTPFWASHRAQVTTSSHRAAAALRNRPPGHPLVVFCTYHSAPVAAAAAAATASCFDILIADEAHHLAGQPRHDFRIALSSQLPARKRVFMTATHITRTASPSEGGADFMGPVSMDDGSLFGPVAYRLDFADAIEQNLLCDYEVLIYEAPGENTTPDPVAALTAAAQGLSRVLTFHGRVAKAQAFAEAVDGHVLPDGRRVVARAVAGVDPAIQRARTLELLKDPDPTTLVVISSARCLTEGVDIPAVDGVLFADPKNSDVDVVQAVGRALRRRPGKRRGQVLLPVCVAPDLDEDTLLSTSSFAAVWRILRGLRFVDTRLAGELSSLQQPTSRRGVRDGSRPSCRVAFELPSVADVATLVARLVDATSPAWDAFFDELVTFAAEHGHSRPPTAHRLHGWCERQRRAHRCGLLVTDRVQALRALPGWAWDLDEQTWSEHWAAVSAVAIASPGQQLDPTDPHSMTRPIPRPSNRTGITTVGRWCAHQRIQYRAGNLDHERACRLAEVPGWTWSALDLHDTVCVDLLSEYAVWKHDANPPADYVEDDQPVGAWLQDVRRRRAIGTLDQALLDELEVLTPRGAASGALQWRRPDTSWCLGLEALRHFIAREGRCRVPDQHIEELPDTTVALSVWCRHQRYEHRYGHLRADRVAALNSVPGWLWEIQPTPRIDIDIGDARHGTRTGYVKGCRCGKCTDANLQAHREREARARAGDPSTDLVPAARACGHLRILDGQGASQKALARAADLNVKTVVELLDGARTRIRPETEATILTLTLDRVTAAARPGTSVPAGPTWKLVDDLVDRGWTKSWIARELGRTIQNFTRRGAQVTAATETQIADLHRRVGDLHPPPPRSRRPVPPLEEILAAAADQPA